MDPWPYSSVTKKELDRLIEHGLLHPITTLDPHSPEWMVPLPGHVDPHSLVGYVVSFLVFHEWGLGLPLLDFLRGLLHHYKVELHNLNPNRIL